MVTLLIGVFLLVVADPRADVQHARNTKARTEINTGGERHFSNPDPILI